MSNIYQRHRRRVHRQNLDYIKNKCKNYRKSMRCKASKNILYNFYYKEKNTLNYVVKKPVYLNNDYVINNSRCTKGFRNYYENLLKGEVKEKCVKILMFINKKNLKVFLGYHPKCGLYIYVKSPLLKDDAVLPCNDSEMLEKVEDLKDELNSSNKKLEACRNTNKMLLEKIRSMRKQKITFGAHDIIENVGVNYFDFIKIV
jgi:hypothetical protein